MYNQRTLNDLEEIGSDFVRQDGSHIVSRLNGSWGCSCDFMQRDPRAKKGEYCRGILTEMLRIKEERISLLESQILSYEETGKKIRCRGLGCSYKIKKPRKEHYMILKLLSEYRDGRSNLWIRLKLKKEYKIRMSDAALNGRISECLGAEQGWIRMSRDHRVICFEDDTGSINYQYDEDGYKKPIYFITQAGWEILNQYKGVWD